MKKLVLALCLIALSCVAVLPAMADGVPLPGDSVYQVDARAEDQAGQAVVWSSLRGRPTIVSMFYANCHLMCPLIIASGKALQGRLPPEQRDALAFAMISIDPARDTPAALREVAQMHRLDTAHWRLLRPEDNDVRTLAAALGIRYRAQPDGSFNHTSVLILLDRDGRIVARSEVAGLQPDPGFVSRVREHLSDATLATD
ncbi:SCO family protein [Lysobacter arvi]|uniref:SCO family protein n=1 Tax=Lysobacter arvi TaxID=3038776 RepID=A0ABU1CEU5_9GAMM|nr:SCO family protein [Lysobacter arvi]MDR0183395.1 SCO family protein [Lysobacter arvi]